MQSEEKYFIGCDPMMTDEDLKKIKNRDPEIEMIQWIGPYSNLANSNKIDPEYWKWRSKYQIQFSVPIALGELEEAYAHGMLKKEQLQDGKYYWGSCRNAWVALWSAQKNLFFHMRFKGAWRIEYVAYPGEEEIFEVLPGKKVGRDIFIPWVEVEPLPFEIVESLDGYPSFVPKMSDPAQKS